MKQKAEWELKQIHEREVRTILMSGGEMDQSGLIRAWHGAATMERLRAHGHNSVGFDRCSCRGDRA